MTILNFRFISNPKSKIYLRKPQS